MTRDERAVATEALERHAADADHDTIEWPATAERIRDARVRADLSEGDLAERLQITREAYADLERYDDEVFTCISLAELAALGRALGVNPRALLFGSANADVERVDFSEIAARLRGQLRDDLNVDQLGDRIGWDVAAILNDPAAMWEYNVVALYDISKAVGVDWTAALPD